MLIALNLAAALASLPVMQDPPREAHEDVRIVIVGDGGGPGPLDKDEDGFVSRDEFSGPVTNAFSGLDKDGDGRLSEDELKAGAPDGPIVLRHGEPGLGGVRRFQLESDGPGEHDVFEMVEHGEDGHRIIVRTLREDGEHGDARIHVRRFGDGAMDKDGDGRVTRDEFIAPLVEAFGRLDKDGSGALEEGERDGD
jgi:hypothetical protein